MPLQLVIGSKNYSSWSLRPWLLLRHYDLNFGEIRIDLFDAGYEEQLRRYSPSGRVPVLIDEELSVWESLAIIEYLNEVYLDHRALPKGREARALCRSYCAEMHSGFPAIRSELPMNCRARRSLQLSTNLRQEVARVDQLWVKARRRFVNSGDFLFGQFSMADCMFAPVALRFHSYGVQLSATAAEYQQQLLSHKDVHDWCDAAAREKAVLTQFEVGTETDS